MDKEKVEERKGNFKNADLLKMHAYKDAIRRTGGAYILYPGTEEKALRGFHEIIPGLGAFAINPSEDKSGIEKLSLFVDKVVSHLLDRSSQREKMSSKIYDIHKFKKTDNEQLHESFPHYHKISDEVRLIPDETYILVGYCRNSERMKWYINNNIYNFRVDDDKGSLILDNKMTQAKFLLLRERGCKKANKIFRIVSRGPKVYSKTQLIKMGYPISKNSKEYYLTVQIEPVDINDFGHGIWEFTKLISYQKLMESEKNVYKRAGIPFVITLTELMKVFIKDKNSI